MDLARATCMLTGEGHVLLDDPGSSWQVQVQLTHSTNGFPVIGHLAIVAKEPARPLTEQWLRRLDLRAITRMASAFTVGDYPNETYYRRLAVDGGVGTLDHSRRLLQVTTWAQQVSYPGGAAGAVSQFWGVSTRTAYRWLRAARRHAPPLDPLEPDGERPPGPPEGVHTDSRRTSSVSSRQPTSSRRHRQHRARRRKGHDSGQGKE